MCFEIKGESATRAIGDRVAVPFDVSLPGESGTATTAAFAPGDNGAPGHAVVPDFKGAVVKEEAAGFAPGDNGAPRHAVVPDLEGATTSETTQPFGLPS